MSTKDIIKSSVLAGLNTDISMTRIIMTLGITIAFALLIFVVYRLKSDSNFYSKDFNTAMVLMSVVTAAIVLAMQSNLVISLGMVGALSIVRFRNAVKNPLDLLFLFWSISVGIICGAGLYTVALAASLAVTALLFLLDLLPMAKAPYLLIVNCDKAAGEQELLQAVRTRTVTAEGRDYVIELHTKQEAELVQACETLPGCHTVTLMAHDGELRS